MSLVKSLAKWSATSNEVNSGKSDLLLRYFQSSVFDAWIALQYLHQNTQPGVHDYLCNRLHELGEEAIEKYLLQFVYLAVSKPGQALERTIVDLCSKSFRVAIKTQWLLVALCQDHPKSKALEGFRERAYKAALEGKWEVPIRNPKLDPLSPYNSYQLSPPFSPVLSPGSSLMLSHLNAANPHPHELLSQQQQHHHHHHHHDMQEANELGRDIATLPPGRMVMSPPGPGLAAAPARLATADDSDSAPVLRRRSGALQIDLGCLLPQDQRASTAGADSAAEPGAAAIAAQPPPPHAPAAAAVNGFLISTIEPSANGLAIKTPAAGALREADVRSGSRAPSIGSGGYASVGSGRPSPAPTAAAAPNGGQQGRANGHSIVSAAALNLAERIQSLRRELGEGEGVTALLERSKQQGVGLVAATEEENLMSDDEFSNRPMSPLTRLRYDTFGATLDFVDALCDASSALTSYSQEERHRALRLGLQHINREIEAANRRDVAIWFPMGRGGDRVLRLTAREAVLLNSREKAPFMLFVEVLEGQPECEDKAPQPSCGDAAPAAPVVEGSGAFAGVASCVGGADGTTSSMLGVGAPQSSPVVEFGRRETYGIALTGIGAQHQHQFMHSSPVGAAAAGTGSSASGSALAPTGVTAAAQQDGHDRCSQVGSATSGRASLPSNGAPTADTSSTVADTPGVLSPSMSLSSQFRSTAGSPTSQTQTSGPTHGSLYPAGPNASHAHNLSSPTPTHACSTSQATMLEEQAATAAAARRGQLAGAGASGVTEQAAEGPSAGNNVAVGGAPVSTIMLHHLATSVVIPTRSASSTNIAAAAAAAMAAASNGGTYDAGPVPLSARSSEGGAAAAAAGGGQPQTPRGVSANLPPAGLPPRPPAPALPAGSISPINAAKEVSPHVAAQSSGGMLGASSLLRRVLGDRADEPASGGSGGSGGSTGSGASVSSAARVSKEGPSGFSVVRSLCFSNPDAAVGSPDHVRSDVIASAAVAAAAATAAQPGSSAGSRRSPGQQGLIGGGAGATPQQPPAQCRPNGAELTYEEMQELLASGCLSPQSLVKSDPDMTSRLAGLLASLRGEAPMVRVRIRVLPQPPPNAAAGPRHGFEGGGPQPSAAATQQQGAAAGAVGSVPLPPLDRRTGGTSGDGSSWAGGSSAAGAPAGSSELMPASLSFSLASLGSRAKAALTQPQPVSEDNPAAATVTATENGQVEKSKAMALLSRLGLCRKPTTDEDYDGAIPGAGASAAAGASLPGGAGSAPPAAAPGSGGGGPAWPQRQWGSSASGGRLVQLSLEVAQGVNLAIPSPYRKSRRTPSHEAIEMLAGKYKVQTMPPPYECGPPLGPSPYDLSGEPYSMRERPSEEGEGAAVLDAYAEPSFSHGHASAIALLSNAGSPAGFVQGGAQASGDRTADVKAKSGLSEGLSSGFLLGGQPAAASPEAGTNGPAAARPADVASPPTPTLHQRTGRPTTPPPADGVPAAASPGLAASLQSSLTRMLSRASGQQQQQSLEGAQAASTSTPTVPSPRASSPVRGAPGSAHLQGAAAAVAGPSSSGPSRLARLIGGGGNSSSSPQDGQQGAGQAQGKGGGTAPPTLPYGGVKVTDGRQERESLEERRRREAVAVYGERWAAKAKRIQRESPHGCRAGWALRCVIVKSGDDCRQELLALQMVRTFGELFREAGLPLWVRHYEVLVTSNRTALIEMVPNTLSIHTIKSRSPPGTSLSDHFFAKFGRAGTPSCTAAQRRFTESLAAYSLICYILQIKDRHNGNILVDDDGRIVHIDFGFLLSNSPGGVNFESAPFKLTRELLEVMDSNSDGRPSEMFDYFKVLMIQGFLALRKHGDRVMLLVRMMSRSGFPCFKAGERAVKALEKRLQLPLNEVQCVAHVLQLIAESLDAWRTRQYDYYQRVLNGIL